MATARTQCPNCSAGIRLRSAPPPGRKIRCPRCKSAFVPVHGGADRDERRVQQPVIDSVPEPTSEPNADQSMELIPDIVTAQPSLSGRRRNRRNPAQPVIFVTALAAICGVAVALWLYQRPNVEQSTPIQRDTEPTAGDSPALAESNLAAQQQSEVVKKSVQPLTLHCIPVTPQFLLHLRPAELWAGTSINQEFAISLGELGDWLRNRIETTTRLQVSQIEELTIAINFGSRGSMPDFCMLVRPVVPNADSPDWLTQLVGEPLEGLADDAREYSSFAWMKINARSYAVATGDLVNDLTDSRHYPALPTVTMAKLLPQTDRSDHLTLLGDISALDAHRDFVLPQRTHDLSEVLLSRLRDDVSTLSWSLHLSEHLAMRAQLAGNATTSAPQLERRVSELLEASPMDMLTFVKTLRPPTVGRQKLMGRLPAMMQALHWGTTASITDRVVLLSTLLPPKAAANFSAAAFVSLDDHISGTRPGTEMNSPVTNGPVSISDQLQRSVLIDFRREPLREAIAYLNTVLDAKIQIDATALEASGFTQNMPQTLNLGKIAVLGAITAMLEQYEGKLILAANEEQTTLTLTTPAAADKQGLMNIATE